MSFLSSGVITEFMNGIRFTENTVYMFATEGYLWDIQIIALFMV